MSLLSQQSVITYVCICRRRQIYILLPLRAFLRVAIAICNTNYNPFLYYITGCGVCCLFRVFTKKKARTTRLFSLSCRTYFFILNTCLSFAVLCCWYVCLNDPGLLHAVFGNVAGFYFVVVYYCYLFFVYPAILFRCLRVPFRNSYGEHCRRFCMFPSFHCSTKTKKKWIEYEVEKVEEQFVYIVSWTCSICLSFKSKDFLDSRHIRV